MNRREEIRKLVVFGLIGVASAGIDAGVFVLLTWLGVWPWLASGVSFCSAFVVNYSGNRSLVFRARNSRGALLRYTILVLVNLGISSAGVGLLDLLGVHPFIAKLITMVIIAACNYVAMRMWVFPSPKTDTSV